MKIIKCVGKTVTVYLKEMILHDIPVKDLSDYLLKMSSYRIEPYLHNENGYAVDGISLKEYWLDGVYYPTKTAWEQRIKELKFNKKLEKIIE